MGTGISLDLPTGSADQADAVFDFMREIDAQFSTYRADSEVSRSGQPDFGPAGKKHLGRKPASPRLQLVLDRCAALWSTTSGYFDAYATGRLDPSGFVKGWAVQVASDRLVEAGCPDHCVNAGGDLRVRGHAEDGQPWRIGIRHPFEADRVCAVVVGTDLAVATSGVYERGHHVFNPFTGTPAHGLRSVTVTGADLGDADAYATAALAMGRAGLDWLSTLDGYESAVVTDEGEFFSSPNFPALPSTEDSPG
jgi:FAD:protein FMN transferase